MKVKLTHPECLPHVGSGEAAGMDLRAYLGPRASDIMIPIGPRGSQLLDTGVAIEIPEGWVGLVIPRSSLGKRKLMILNTVGVIDSDYRGTIKLGLYNYGHETQTIENFERLCQLVIVPHWNPKDIQLVEALEDTERGEGGFGSTGTH